MSFNRKTHYSRVAVNFNRERHYSRVAVSFNRKRHYSRVAVSFNRKKHYSHVAGVVGALWTALMPTSAGMTRASSSGEGDMVLVYPVWSTIHSP